MSLPEIWARSNTRPVPVSIRCRGCARHARAAQGNRRRVGLWAMVYWDGRGDVGRRNERRDLALLGCGAGRVRTSRACLAGRQGVWSFGGHAHLDCKRSWASQCERCVRGCSVTIGTWQNSHCWEGRGDFVPVRRVFAELKKNEDRQVENCPPADDAHGNVNAPTRRRVRLTNNLLMLWMK